MAVKIRIEVLSNAQQIVNRAKTAFSDLQEKNKEASKRLQQNWKDVAAAVGIALIAFNKVKQFFDGLIKSYETQVVANTKLEASLRATGYAAGFSRDELMGVADALAEVTIYANEALVEAEGLLLTFTKIGRDVFPQALEAGADMSAMFGQDLRQSMIQLGTALNDPIAGVGRLRRIGISFTEEQKDMIQGFVEANDIMAAQTVILEEIQREFGGVARAMGESAIGQLKQLNNQWVDMQEKAGEALLKGLLPLLDTMEEFITYLESNVGIFEEIGAAIAFLGKIILGVIQFIIEFKEAIAAYLIVVYGVPAAMQVASAAVAIFNAVVAANPIGIMVAAIVAAIAALAKLVISVQDAKREFEELKQESIELQNTLLLDAATGGIENIGELNAALSQLREKQKKLNEEFVQANNEQRQELFKLIWAYNDLADKIENQIELRRQQQLVEDAAAQSLVVYDDYIEALDIVNSKIKQSRDEIEQLTEVRRRQAELSGEEFVPPDLPKMREQIKLWEELAREIEATAEEVQQYGADFKAVLEERERIEQDFTQKIIDFTSSRIETLEQEKEIALKQAEEVGAETYNIYAYYNQLIAEEYQAMADARAAFEQEFIDKLEGITLSRVELLEKERDKALEVAREKGADELIVVQYYKELIRQTIEEENEKALALEKANIQKIEDEYRQLAEERKRFQRETVDYIVGLSDQWLLSESEILEKRKARELDALEEIAANWRENIGYIADESGQISLQMDTPGEWATMIEGAARSQEEIAEYTAEYERTLAQARETEIRIAQAREAVADSFREQITAAQEQERLAGLVGDTYLDQYGTLQDITAEMLSQEQAQREIITGQIQGLTELIRSVENQMEFAGAETFIERLPYMEIVQQAAEAITFLQAELAKIPTEAEKEFLELTKKIGIISEKYIDPLEKKRALLEEEYRNVQAYIDALREKFTLQGEHIKTLEAGTAVYEQERAAFEAMGNTLAEAEALADKISQEIADTDVAIGEGGEGEESVEIATAAMGGLAAVAMWLVEQLISLIQSTETFQQYMDDLNTVLVSLMENAVVPLLEALQPIVYVLIEVVKVVVTLLIPIFEMLAKFTKDLMPLWNALGSILVKVVAILQAVFPLIFIIADLLGTILMPVADALSVVLSILADVVVALTPVFNALGYVADAVGRVFLTLWTILEFLSSHIRALGEMIYFLVTFQWDRIKGIRIMTPSELVSELASIWSESWRGNEFQQFAIDPTTIPDLAVGLSDVSELDEADFGATIYGGNVTIQRVPDIYFYNTFQGNIIGPGGMAELGEIFAEMLTEYAGIGGNPIIITGG